MNQILSSNVFLKEATLVASFKQRLSLFLAVLSSFSLSIFLYHLSHYLTNLFLSQHNQKTIYLFLLLSLFLFLIFDFLSNFTAQKASSTSIKYIKNYYINNLLSQNYTHFTSKNSAYFLSNIEEMNNKLKKYFYLFYRMKNLTLITPLYILIFISFHSFLVVFILLISLLLLPITLFIVGKHTSEKSKKQLKSLNILSKQFLDIIRGMETLKIFNQNNLFKKKLQDSNEDYRIKTMNILKVAFLNTFSLDFFASIVTAIVAVVIGYKLSLGTMDFHSGLFMLFITPQFFIVFKQFAINYHVSKDAYALVDNLLSDIKIQVPLSKKKQNTQTLNTITIKNLSIIYDYSRHPIFNHLNFSIPTKSILGITGKSGYGKTTLINALINQIDYQGDILIDNEKVQSLMPFVSHLSQKPFFFNTTLLNNITLHEPSIKKENIEYLLKKLNLKESILKKEEKLQYHLNNNNFKLSGGELKRVSIIRTLVRDKPIYVLDEPTQNLDTKNITSLMELFQEYTNKNKKTIIFTSHSKEIEPYCDYILHFKGETFDFKKVNK